MLAPQASPVLLTAARDAGVSLRVVQVAASHADPRTTMRYDRACQSLERHATYVVAASSSEQHAPRELSRDRRAAGVQRSALDHGAGAVAITACMVSDIRKWPLRAAL